MESTFLRDLILSSIVRERDSQHIAIGSVGSFGPSFPTFGMGASPLNLAAPQSAPAPAANPVAFLQLVVGAMAQMQGGWGAVGGQQASASNGSSALGDAPFAGTNPNFDQVRPNGTSLVLAGNEGNAGNGDALGSSPFAGTGGGGAGGVNGTSIVAG